LKENAVMSTAQSLQQAWPPPKSPIPIAIIGAGGIVNDGHMPAYRKAGFEVAGIFDENGDRALLTAERWQIARVWTSLDEVIADTAARNVVFDVAIPPTATLPLLERLPSGASVLMQKPMGVNLEQARAIVDCCRRRKLVAAVNHQLRFAPYMLAVRDAFQRGWLGAMTDIEMQLNCTDPWHLFPFLEQLERVEIQVHSIHYLDLIRSLLGEPAGVYALTIPDARFPKLRSTRSSIILNYGGATRVCLSLNHNYAHGSHRQAATFKFEGDRGVVWIRIGVMLDYPKGQPDLFEIKIEGRDWETLTLAGSWFPDAFIGPMSNLQRVVSGEDSVLLTGVDDVLNTMRLVEAAYESSAGGGTALSRFS
jgi:predicted dehydrogenase